MLSWLFSLIFYCSWWSFAPSVSGLSSQHQWRAYPWGTFYLWFWEPIIYGRKYKGAHLEGISRVQSEPCLLRGTEKYRSKHATISSYPTKSHNLPFQLNCCCCFLSIFSSGACIFISPALFGLYMTLLNVQLFIGVIQDWSKFTLYFFWDLGHNIWTLWKYSD